MTPDVNSIAVRAERDLAIAAMMKTQSAVRSRRLLRAGALPPSLRRALYVLGTYFLLWGILLTLGWVLSWISHGRLGPGGARQVVGTQLYALLPWVLFATAFVLVGLGLILQRWWARWGGTALALMFLAGGIASPRALTANIPSLLIAYIFPILALAVLLSPWPRAMPTDPVER